MASRRRRTRSRGGDTARPDGQARRRRRDSPGFVSNRVLMLTVNEAVRLLEEGVASSRDIDDMFASCFGHAMGPLETADLIGLDTIVRTLDVLPRRCRATSSKRALSSDHGRQRAARKKERRGFLRLRGGGQGT